MLATVTMSFAGAQTPPDRALHVTIDGVSIQMADLIGLVKDGLTAGGNGITETVERKPGEMPAGYSYVYYAGRDSKTGREIIWVALPPADAARVQVNDEAVAATALALLDANKVGDPWKSLYRGAVRDGASQVAFGKAIARVFDEASDQMETLAAGDASWIHEHIVIGMTRQEAYAALRTYGLVAYNWTYDQNCDFADEINAAWPYSGEPLPQCRTRPHFGMTLVQPPAEAFPSASINLKGAFTMGCGSNAVVTIAFDNSDHVTSVRIPKPEWSCV